MDAYSATQDSLRLMTLTLEGKHPGTLPFRSVFAGEAPAVGVRRIEAAISQLADQTVVALVSTFERRLRDHVIGRPWLDDRPRGGVDRAVRDQIVGDVEYWKLSEDVLPLFRDVVDRNLIGQVKQIIGYRNWVAHGRSVARPPDANVGPQFAFAALSKFMEQGGLD